MTKSLIIGIIAAIVVVGAGTGTGVYFATKSSNNNSSNTNSSQAVPTAEPTTPQQRITAGNCISDTCLQVPNLNFPVGTPNQNVADTLNKVLDNEYKLAAYYQAVLNKYPERRPFSMIAGAEAQHIAVMTSLDAKYGVSPVTDKWSGQSYSISSFQAACQTSATYEKDTVNLINGYLPQFTNYPDITQALTNIKDAAQNNHLPAFEQCS